MSNADVHDAFVADLVMTSNDQIAMLEHLSDHPGFRREAGPEFLEALDEVEELFAADPDAHTLPVPAEEATADDAFLAAAA